MRVVSDPLGTALRRIRLGRHDALEITVPSPKRRLIWLHGGGFVVGAPETHATMLSHIARAAEALVIAPRYRLAPEHPFPAGLRSRY